ncbi:MAG: glutamyl-tRNA reductase [Planctomycetes bacterium]|nr:glutamyl-tRNA reductase [Planctomycetota bacterium]
MSAAPAFLLVGLSHKTAHVALRERLAFRVEDIPHALGQLTGPAGFHEAAILSTCNRVEIYAAGGAAADASGLRKFLASFHGVNEAEFAGALYERRGAEAVEHLFEVAASLDSQILGETEILGQAREAYRIAAEAGAAGPVLRQIFERSFFLAKELRGEGGLSGVQASVSSAAVELAEKIFEDLRGARALVLGTGEMAQGIVRSLRAAGVSDLVVASRTLERAEAFAKAEGGRCAPFEKLPEHLAQADIVLVSTAAPHYILTAEHVERAQHARHGKPLFIIDISVPRNVEPEANKRTDTFLYDIDDLEAVAGEGREQREKIAGSWRPKLVEEARSILNELAEPLPGETARMLVAHVSEMRRAEIEALCSAGIGDAEAMERIERAFDRFQSKLLHGALATLKESARDGDGATAAQWVARLFRLHAPQPEGAVKPDAASSPPAPASKEDLKEKSREPAGAKADSKES